MSQMIAVFSNSNKSSVQPINLKGIVPENVDSLNLEKILKAQEKKTSNTIITYDGESGDWTYASRGEGIARYICYENNSMLWPVGTS